MEIDSNSEFPLLATDQADVIRIFLELVSENQKRSGRISEIATDKPRGPHNESDLTQ